MFHWAQTTDRGATAQFSLPRLKMPQEPSRCSTVTTGRLELSKLSPTGFPQNSMDQTPPSLLLEGFIPRVIQFSPWSYEILSLTTSQDLSSLVFHPNRFPQFPQFQRTFWFCRDHQLLQPAEIYSSEMWVFSTLPFRCESSLSPAPLSLPMARLEGPFQAGGDDTASRRCPWA